MIESRSEMTEQQVAGAASLINGNLVALSLVGMAVGGLAAGSLIRPGREKWPLVLTPILMAPAVAAFGVASTTGGALLAVLAGVGYAAMIPVTISLSQRILPHRTSLASGLMLGGAWSVALLGPIGAEFCLHSVGLGLGPTFLLAAGLLLLSGVVCLALPRDFGEALK